MPLKQGIAISYVFLTILWLLVRVVPISAEVKNSPWQRREFSSVTEPKIGEAVFLKDVFILDSPVYVNSEYPSFNTFDFFGSKRMIEPQRFGEGAIASERKRTLFCYLRGYKCRSLFTQQNELNFGNTDDFICWSLSKVFHEHSYPRFICTRWLRRFQHIAFQYSGSLHENVSSQLASPVEDHHADGKDQRNKLEKRDKTGNNCNFVAETPRISWIAWSFAAVSLGFIMCLFGGQYFYDEGRLLGALLFSVGLILGALGFLIWWPTYSSLWRWTWGWIL